MAKKSKTIHPSIKRRLGYQEGTSDKEVLADWKERTTRVCKPCWELKYCPYGPLVEQLPILPTERASCEQHNNYLRNCIDTGYLGEHRKITSEEKVIFSQILSDEQILLHQASGEVANDLWLDMSMQKEDPVEAFESRFRGDLPPLHEYRIPFDHEAKKIDLSKAEPGLRKLIRKKVGDLKRKYKKALESGMIDERKPLDPVRKALFERNLSTFDSSEYPEEVSSVFKEASCNIFGHICPVFFAAEAMTETSELRRKGRYISFKTKMRVVRRDNHTCQHCGTHLRDDEVEFDHKIPVSKGGSSEEHNIRLTCFKCNRDKSDKVNLS